MEYTRNELSPKIKNFFNKMSNYIEEKIYFYGSVQRQDYFAEQSDIDICIFTDNVHTVNNKLQHFLHLKKSKFKKIMWVAKHSNSIVYGYKTKYDSIDPLFRLEITIYNEKYKSVILKAHSLKYDLPYYAVIILILLKFIYYTLPLISKDQFLYYKNKIMNKSLGYDDSKMVIISPKFEVN